MNGGRVVRRPYLRSVRVLVSSPEPVHSGARYTTRVLAQVQVSKPNDAAREIASYVTRQLPTWQHVITEEEIAEGIQDMIDEGRVHGGMVVTGDHEEGDQTVLDWSPLGRLCTCCEQYVNVEL